MEVRVYNNTYLLESSKTGYLLVTLMKDGKNTGILIKPNDIDNENWLKDLAVPIAAAIIVGLGASFSFTGGSVTLKD